MIIFAHIPQGYFTGACNFFLFWHDGLQCNTMIIEYLLSVNNHYICIQTRYICYVCSHWMSVWLRSVMSYSSDSYLHPTLQADVMIISLCIYPSNWDIARALCVTLGCMSIMFIDTHMWLYYSMALLNMIWYVTHCTENDAVQNEGKKGKRWAKYRWLSARKT